jgi:hypothetical protein
MEDLLEVAEHQRFKISDLVVHLNFYTKKDISNFEYGYSL